jgi:glycosyltransferase involved in cell wall biosynthesis
VRRVAAAIPAYQAGAAVERVARHTMDHLPHVLVVDDGSTDGTAEAARRSGARVTRLPVNRGKGHALRTAFALLFAEGFEGVLTLDADGQHLPSEIPKLLAAFEGGADLVLGSRHHLFSSMGRVRRTSNTLSSWAITAGCGERVLDVQTGFRVYSRPLIEAAGFDEPRFEAESAVLCRALRHGYKVVSVPIELGFVDGRTTSHYRPLVDSLRIARAVIRARTEPIPWTPERSS